MHSDEINLDGLPGTARSGCSLDRLRCPFYSDHVDIPKSRGESRVRFQRIRERAQMIEQQYLIRQLIIIK